MRSTKVIFGPPVTRLRRPSSGRGLLNGSSPLGECTDPNSDSVRCRCCPVGHLFLRDNKERKKGKQIKNVTGMLAGLSVLCFRRCPWYLECVVMYAWCESSRYSRWVAEAELLFLFREWSNFGGELFLAPGIWLVSYSSSLSLGGLLRLELALVFPEEERMMQQSSVSISLSF